MITTEQAEPLAKTLQDAYDDHCRDGDMWPFDDMGKAASTIRELARERDALNEKLFMQAASGHELASVLAKTNIERKALQEQAALDKARIKMLEDALREVLEHCNNHGRGNALVDDRIVERCEDAARAALEDGR